MRLSGRFGRFGGCYVPEILVPALEQLEAAFLDAQVELVGSRIAVGMHALGGEMIVLEQVEDRDPPFLLDIGRAPQYGAFVEGDVDDPRVGH
jgi:hypothetical protein